MVGWIGALWWEPREAAGNRPLIGFRGTASGVTSELRRALVQGRGDRALLLCSGLGGAAAGGGH